MPINIHKETYLLLLFVVVLSMLKMVTLYYWWFLPNITLPDSPAITKGVNYPAISIATVIIGIVSFIILLTPVFRTKLVLAFWSGVLVTSGILSFIGTWYLSPNVVLGGAIFIILGIHIIRLLKNT